MFDTARLKAEWEACMQAPMAPELLELTQFFHADFESPQSEQLIGIVRGAREDFSDVLRFWIRASTAGEAFGGEPGPEPSPYVKSALYTPINRAEFDRVVKECSESLLSPLPAFILQLSGWRSGLRMHDDWNEVAIVADLDDCYLLFAWSTSA